MEGRLKIVALKEVELAEGAARDRELAKRAERDAAAKAEQHAAEVVAREANQKEARDAR